MRSHFLLACCFVNNKGERTLIHCVSLCVGLETRDKVSYLTICFNISRGNEIFIDDLFTSSAEMWSEIPKEAVTQIDARF